MRYNIYKNGDYVNAIEADEAFVTHYCDKNGYTYEEIEVEPAPETPDDSDSITAEEALAILIGGDAS